MIVQRQAHMVLTRSPQQHTRLRIPNTGVPVSTRRIYQARNKATSDAVLIQDGLIFQRGRPGSWDEGAVGSPVVRCYMGDNETRWYMWYSGRNTPAPNLDLVAPSSGSVGVAVSSDGVNWRRVDGSRRGLPPLPLGEPASAVLTPNTDWWTFDTCHVSASDVQMLASGRGSTGGAGVYWMMYTGGDFEEVQLPSNFPGAAAAAAAGGMEGARMRIGLAMSQDGSNWARIEGDHHTGALIESGQPGEWDELYVAAPALVNAGPGDLRLYYHSYCTRRQRFVVGAASSPDGFRWTKKGVVFDPSSSKDGSGADGFNALGATTLSVVFDPSGRQFVMFYEAVSATGRRSIGLATSKDGWSNWSSYSSPILSPSSPDSPEGAWDSGGVGAPCAVQMSEGRWRLYYAGRAAAGSGANDGVGLCLSVVGSPTFNGVPTEFKRRKGPGAL